MRDMKNILKNILVIAALSLAFPVYAIVYTGNSDWTQPFTPDTYTMGLWHFNEVSGDTLVVDATGNSADGTLEGGLNPSTLWQTSAVPYSGFGNMVSTTSGSTGKINVPGTSDIATNPLFCGPNQDLTIEFWIWYNGNFYDPGQVIVQSRNYSDYGIQGYFWPSSLDDPAISLGWHNDWSPTGDGIPMTLGAWTHYAFTADRTSGVNDRLTFWVNGVKVREESGTAMSDYFAGEVMLLGRSVDDRANFAGQLDGLRISNCIRYAPFVPPLSINWIRKVGNDIQIEFNSVEAKLYTTQ